MAVELPQGYALVAFDSLDSTNKKALELAQTNEFAANDAFNNLVVFTKHQTAGRGRNGRTWLSSDQTLTASILLKTHAPRAKVAQLAFVMAIAAHKTTCDFITPEAYKKIGLKWPNDLLAQGRKLAGILIESAHIKSSSATILAIGIGMNIGNIPQDEDFSATSLSALGADANVEQVLSKLIYNFDKYFDLWSDGLGFAAIRKIWLDHALGLGGKITARLPNQSIHGVFESLDEDGILILRDEANKIHQITAGDIFIGHI